MHDELKTIHRSDNTAELPFKMRAYSALLGMVSHIPLPLMLVLGSILGELIYLGFRSRRLITQINLTRCFPDLDKQQISKLARQHFRHMATSLFTLSIALWGSREKLLQLCHCNDSETLRRITRQEEPIILLAPHFTNLEVLGVYLSCISPLCTMYQTHKNPALDQLIKNRRSRFGLVLFDNKGASTSMIKSIRDGTPFYYLPDQDPGRKRGVFAPFYGVPAATYPTLGKIARVSRATVIPVMAYLRKGGDGFEVVFGEPLANFPTDDPVADATAMNRAIEKLIDNAPEQYYWSHKRFKTRPPGEPDFYS